MFRKSLVSLIILQFIFHPAFSQVSVKDSAIVVPMIYVTYAYQLPAGDLAKRFGGNSSIGGGFMIKTRSNWLFAAEGNYIFGSDVKNGDSLLKNIATPDGYVINSNGYYAEIGFGETGFNVLGKFGKLFPVLSPNPNSGPLIMIGGGFLQDKIRIHDEDNTAPQVHGDYKKGYDRLNNGWILSGTVGYLYLSDSRLINFFVGFEFMQSWNKYRRARNFDTGLQDNSSLSTQFYGVKVKWFIPLYKRKPKNFYLY
ncbi:MAG: hypothetical protein ABSE72_08815 [Bacteroidales bacterium]|jgi:hypothetical protein